MIENKDDDFGLMTWVAIVAAVVFVGLTRWKQNTPTTDLVAEDTSRVVVVQEDKKEVKTTNTGTLATQEVKSQPPEVKKEEPVVVPANTDPVWFQYFADKNYTKIARYADFAPNEFVTRGQGANYLAVYGVENNLEEVYTTDDCQFADIDQTEGDPAIDKMTQSCLYGLMRGSNGDFIPSRIMKTSEVLAVLVRSEQGYLDETTDPRFLNYFEQAKELGIIGKNNDITTFEKDIDRKTFATWIYSLMNRKGE